MDSLPLTAPHFIGLFAAIALSGVATILLTRQRVRARLGRRLPMVVVATVVALLPLGVFGSGVHGNAGRGRAFSGHNLPAAFPVSQAAVERALEVALSPRFIAYHGRLTQTPIAFTSESFADCMTWTWKPDLSTLPGVLSSGRPPEKVALDYLYVDTGNPFLAIAGVDAEAREQRRVYVDAVFHDYLPSLVWLEALREAPDADARITVLAGMSALVPTAAEWILAGLASMDENFATEPEQAGLAATRALVQRYIDDPTMRGLPAGRSASVD